MKTALLVLVGAFICTSSLVVAAPNERDTQEVDNLPNSELSNVWVNLGGFSGHFNRHKGYNENNAGFGIEYRVNADVSVMAGSYENSVRQNTSYAGLSWQPLAFGDWKVGAAIGLMDGYPAMDRGGTFFVALPMASWEGKRFGVNLGIIPTIPKVDGAVVIQFKFRL